MRRVVKLEVQPTPKEGAVARRVASAVLQNDHANAAEVAAVELVTSELVANAVEASSGTDAVAVSLELGDEAVRVSVANRGDDFEPTDKLSKPSDLRGRGLSIARSLGELSVAHEDRTTTVSVDVPLSAKE